MSEIKINDDERLDDLEINGYRIIQKKSGFCFGSDSVLLSGFASQKGIGIKKNSSVLDLGTGTGVIGILLCAKTSLKDIYGIEIQKNMAEMAGRSVKLNNLQDKMKILNYDIKEIPNVLEKNSFDAVVTNPPYKSRESGVGNVDVIQDVSRHETSASLEDFISVSGMMLNSQGSFYMVNRVERMAEIFEIMRRNKIEPKVLRFIYSNENSEGKLFLIKGVKNGRRFLKVLSPLIMYKEDGSYTDEVLKIYGKI